MSDFMGNSCPGIWQAQSFEKFTIKGKSVN